MKLRIFLFLVSVVIAVGGFLAFFLGYVQKTEKFQGPLSFVDETHCRIGEQIYLDPRFCVKAKADVGAVLEVEGVREPLERCGVEAASGSCTSVLSSRILSRPSP